MSWWGDLTQAQATLIAGSGVLLAAVITYVGGRESRKDTRTQFTQTLTEQRRQFETQLGEQRIQAQTQFDAQQRARLEEASIEARWKNREEMKDAMVSALGGWIKVSQDASEFRAKVKFDDDVVGTLRQSYTEAQMRHHAVSLVAGDKIQLSFEHLRLAGSDLFSSALTVVIALKQSEPTSFEDFDGEWIRLREACDATEDVCKAELASLLAVDN
ncbi:hypothetical protein LCL87_25020 [Rhodococcus hoagii]|nr:hypothetical protein [Prescottella equi]